MTSFIIIAAFLLTAGLFIAGRAGLNKLRERRQIALEKAYRDGYKAGARQTAITAALEAENVFPRRSPQFRARMRQWCAINGLNVDLEAAVAAGRELDRVSRNKGES